MKEDELTRVGLGDLVNMPKRILSALTGPIPVTRSQAIGVSERLSAVTALTSSLEYLAQRKQFRRGGLNHWPTMARGVQGPPVFRKLLNAISREKVTTGLHVARITVGAGLLLPGQARWRGAGNLFLGVTTAALYPRHRYGTDGSDQVSILVQTATGMARLSTRPQTQDALLWYVALQANASYLISGWMKLLGRTWKDATALSGIMRTRSYGHEPTFELTKKYPKAAKHLTHGVLALECLFPVVYLAGGRLARPVIASAGVFHVANGLVMGLGRFVTAFTSMHPMVAYTSTPRAHPSVADRDDRFLFVGAALLAGAASVAGVVAAQRRMRTLEGWPHSSYLTTRHGNELQYQRSEGDNPALPVLVFVNGLASTSEHFAWITEKITQESGYGVVTYARAGYAGSKYRSTAPYCLAESVDDLVDLVRGVVPEGRKVVLVGHSLGGDLARRAAANMGEQLQGIVYLDSSHPDELNRSNQQNKAAESVAALMNTMARSLHAGLGILLARPDWLEALPASCRTRVFAQYTDARLWEAGRREWAVVQQEFRDFDGTLPAVDAHALVISAQQTVDRDPEQLLMHNEIAEMHRAEGRYVESVVLEGADHDSLLTSARFATEAGRQIVAFLDGTQAADTPQVRVTEEAGQ
ncbi:alpha/beta fold hydrolase [Streptomyces decoyicus]|uniref:alpha/beta fold hydrolase n=1 Tax=Streptomyces decoyicus TaxID=249567 RepID=UPI003401E223